MKYIKKLKITFHFQWSVVLSNLPTEPIRFTQLIFMLQIKIMQAGLKDFYIGYYKLSFLTSVFPLNLCPKLLGLDFSQVFCVMHLAQTGKAGGSSYFIPFILWSERKLDNDITRAWKQITLYCSDLGESF